MMEGLVGLAVKQLLDQFFPRLLAFLLGKMGASMEKGDGWDDILHEPLNREDRTSSAGLRPGALTVEEEMFGTGRMSKVF